jgi:hypothetical protein
MSALRTLATRVVTRAPLDVRTSSTPDGAMEPTPDGGANPARGSGASRAPDAGMNTAEYAVGTLAAVAFAGILLAVLTSDPVRAALQAVVERALG